MISIFILKVAFVGFVIITEDSERSTLLLFQKLSKTALTKFNYDGVVILKINITEAKIFRI